MDKTKKKEGLARLLEIAGQKKGLLVLAGLLSAGSAVCMLVPYLSVYEILKELLEHGASPASADGAVMMRWGWIAFGGLAGGLVLLYAALMSSHVAAFRILYGLRVRLSEHIGRLPLGYLNNTSTGAIKKTMDQNIEK
ncbi:MAG TPA: ABC transporter ATP-binding protein, partial [Candidatus Cryptobacteroides intestinipullorum]|nr:ABC transporter ATP-binding protein [Candidatus Cryptobacteroides intestinipullorum]